MKYWLVKQEPAAYSWDDFVAEGKTDWTGVRNFQARNFLKEMKKGDRVFFYPRSGATYAGDAATRASAEFDELASLEG